MTGAALRMTWRGGTTEGNEGEIVKNISRESQQDRENEQRRKHVFPSPQKEPLTGSGAFFLAKGCLPKMKISRKS